MKSTLPDVNSKQRDCFTPRTAQQSPRCLGVSGRRSGACRKYFCLHCSGDTSLLRLLFVCLLLCCDCESNKDSWEHELVIAGRMRQRDADGFNLVSKLRRRGPSNFSKKGGRISPGKRELFTDLPLRALFLSNGLTDTMQ